MKTQKTTIISTIFALILASSLSAPADLEVMVLAGNVSQAEFSVLENLPKPAMKSWYTSRQPIGRYRA
jgi:hypothetical protein